MSPQTMSYSRIPRDHTVAERPWYRWYLIHSGGLYTRVPIRPTNQNHFKTNTTLCRQKDPCVNKMKVKNNQESDY